MSERLLEVYPNEMEARMWEGILLEEGIRSLVKPHLEANPYFGHATFLPHALYVMDEDIPRARGFIGKAEGNG